jgi:FKBP-type peptidyl-prolyl cis-trans isomerase
MRRFLALIAIPVMACLVLAACGGSAKPAASSSASSAGATGGAVSASGAFDSLPTVTIPKARPDNKLTVKTLIQGTGSTVTKADSLITNFVLYYWDGTTSSQKASTYNRTPSLIGGTMLPGLQSALFGQKVGSRVLAVIPPADGYGKNGNPQLGITPTTTLVFVIDVLRAYANNASATGAQQSPGGGSGVPTVTAKAGSAPAVTVPSSAPPNNLIVQTLIKGNGAKVAKGQYVVAQYVGYIWKTKKVFGSSWSTGSPFGFITGASPEQVIPGFDKGIQGQTVGSRVLLVIPPAQGYGKPGQAQAGIKGTDTLVFVVDILDALKAS